MKNLFFILALIANVASAQNYMHFRIIPDHDHNMLSSSDNDSVEWVVFIDDLYEPSETPDFKPLREAECIFDSGSTVLNYRTYTLGTHHLLLRNKISGQNIAYAVLHIDHTTRRVTNEIWTMWIFEHDDPYAVYAPTKENKWDTPYFTPGLLN
tara:strand:+ start:150 stop:608 length:459 start_codon:yes stop_codon:yes gene_type:complete